MTRRTGTLVAALAALTLVACVVQGCSRSADSNTQTAGSGDGAFRTLANEILEFTYKSDPSNATYLGIHRYDSKIRDYSAAGVKADVEAIKGFQARLTAVDAGTLSDAAQLDLQQTTHTRRNAVA